MAILEYHHELFGRYGVYATTVGSADLPSTGGSYQVGDLIMNFAPSSNAVAMWQCLTASPNPTWEEWGSGVQTRTVAPPTTVTPADGLVLLSATGAVGMTAATLWPAGQPVTIKNTSAGSVTLTPASGTVDGAAAVTMTTLTQATLTSNGTVFWKIGA